MAFVIQAALLIDKLHKFLGLSTRAWINVLQPVAQPSLTM